MSDLSPKERLIRVLGKQTVDRPPVICSGGMMNAAIVDVMNSSGYTLPEAHHEQLLMSKLAFHVAEATGFENFGVPFCMTVEAEALGSEIDFGTLACEPKIAREVFTSVSKVDFRDISVISRIPRIESIGAATYRLSEKYSDIPVIGSITGPVSTAASIVDPMGFLKELRKDRDNSHKVMDYVSDFLIQYASILVENGAKVICIGDPTATGEILGPKMFEEYAVRYLNKVIKGIKRMGVPVIVHICGNMRMVKHLITKIESDAISTDALVNLKLLKEEYPELTTMGNVSTYLLEYGTPEKVADVTERLVEDGINIISPACGLSTSTSLNNISAMTRTVKEN